MSSLIGVGQVAGQLRLRDSTGVERKRQRRIITWLDFETVKVDGAGVEARTSAGLEAAQRETVVGIVLRQPVGRELAGAAGGELTQPDVDHAAKEGAGADHDGMRFIRLTHLGDNAAHALAIHQQALDQCLLDVKAVLRLQPRLHLQAVTEFVRLGAVAAHGGALAAVQYAKLDAGLVYAMRHLAAHGVDLAHQMPLGNAADGRIAGHQGNAVQVGRENRRATPHARGGKGGLATRVSSPYDNYIVCAA